MASPTKINENMNLLDDLKIIESKRINKMKFINEHLVSEEIEELLKDKFYLEKLIDLMQNIDNDLQSFIYKFTNSNPNTLKKMIFYYYPFMILINPKIEIIK